jgi:hypothetical protein
MTLATIRRDSQIPQARSGGTRLLNGRNVYVLTAAAPRDRSDPRAGTMSAMSWSQSQMVTLVNGSFGWRLAVALARCASRVGGDGIESVR